MQPPENEGFFANRVSVTNVVTNTLERINNIFQKEGPSIEDVFSFV